MQIFYKDEVKYENITTKFKKSNPIRSDMISPLKIRKVIVEKVIVDTICKDILSALIRIVNYVPKCNHLE